MQRWCARHWTAAESSSAAGPFQPHENCSGAAFLPPYGHRMPTATTTEYDVEIAIPGHLDWCQEASQALVEFISDLAESPQREALMIMPAISVHEADEADMPSELCLSFVRIPGDSAAMGLDRALGVSKLLFGPGGWSELPAMRTVVWDPAQV